MRKKYIIKEEDANMILLYLQEKPYKEVWKGVEILTNLEELPEQTPEDEE